MTIEKPGETAHSVRRKRESVKVVAVIPLEGDDWAQFGFMQMCVSDITAERIKQWKKWSKEHDANHHYRDWADLIEQYRDEFYPTARAARQAFVKIGAIALAAIEAIDRKKIAKKPGQLHNQKRKRVPSCNGMTKRSACGKCAHCKREGWLD